MHCSTAETRNDPQRVSAGLGRFEQEAYENGKHELESCRKERPTCLFQMTSGNAATKKERDSFVMAEKGAKIHSSVNGRITQLTAAARA